MRKLKLQLDALKVEAFVTDGPAPSRGTVEGQSGITCSETCGTGCSGYTDGVETCRGGVETCRDSCDTVCNSYFGSCYTWDCC